MPLQFLCFLRTFYQNLITKLIRILFGSYRFFISPLLGEACRFYPSCSCYAEIAFSKHGLFKGFYLTFFRLLRCHPWHKGGMDLVP